MVLHDRFASPNTLAAIASLMAIRRACQHALRADGGTGFDSGRTFARCRRHATNRKRASSEDGRRQPSDNRKTRSASLLPAFVRSGCSWYRFAHVDCCSRSETASSDGAARKRYAYRPQLLRPHRRTAFRRDHRQPHDSGVILLSDEGALVTEKGKDFLGEFGIDLSDGSRSKRPLCRTCLDWSERRHHIAGRVGAALFQRMLDLGWVARKGR